jgi:NAD(P)-dependent dehydrogenase (short-subunit alcohol dehydrogenase family)
LVSTPDHLSIVADNIVTGAGRGIGFSLVEELANRPNTIIFASVRTVPLKTDEQLAILAAKYPGVVVPIKLTSGGEADNQAAAQLIKDNIGKVDVIIACAGKSSLSLSPFLASVLSPSLLIYSTALIPGSSTGNMTIAGAKLSQVRSDFETNTIGPIVLFQAFESLLAASDAAGGPKFIIISSVLAQITEASDYSYDAYGISKAAVNFVAKKLSQEVPILISFPMQ